MSDTFIRKVYLDDTSTSEDCTEQLGKILATDLDATVTGMFIDNKVKITELDDENNYLASKIVAGDGITKTVIDPGSIETLSIASKGQLKVSSDDTTINYLDDKLKVGSYITKTVENPAGNEDILLDLDLNTFIGTHRGFANDVEATYSLRADETQFDLESAQIKPTSSSQRNVIWRGDTSAAGSIGTIRGVGSAQSMSAGDFTAIDGLLFKIACEKGNWFNIKNDATISDNDDIRKVVTGTAGDLFFLKRALLGFDATLDYWFVLAATHEVWKRRDSIGALPANTDVNVSVNIPQIGYYHFDIYIDVTEETDHISVNTAEAQVLTVKSTAESIIVDTTAICDNTGSTQTKMVNNSLQGSGFLLVNDAAIASRIIQMNVTLPNGTDQAVVGGYIHLTYYGDII